MTASLDSLILSPHFDDGIFSVYSILSDPKTNSRLMTIFSSPPNSKKNTFWDFVCTGKTSVETMKIRKTENNKISDILDIPVIDLDFLDNQYDNDKDPDLIKKNILKYIDKSSTVIYAPLAMSVIYKHPDHVLVRNIAIELLKEGFNVFFYADIPYVNTFKTKTNSLIIFLKDTTGEDFVSSIKILPKSSIKDKFNCMRIYKSQFKMTNLTSIGRLSNPRYFAREIVFKPIRNN